MQTRVAASRLESSRERMEVVASGRAFFSPEIDRGPRFALPRFSAQLWATFLSKLRGTFLPGGSVDLDEEKRSHRLRALRFEFQVTPLRSAPHAPR